MTIIQVVLRLIGVNVRTMIPYSLSGFAATGVNYAVLYILFGVFSVAGISAATLAFAAATGVDFVLQKFWTYRDHRTEVLPRQLGLFLCASLLMLAVNDGIFYALSNVARIDYIFAQIVATIAVSIVGILATKRIFARVPLPTRQ